MAPIIENAENQGWGKLTAIISPLNDLLQMLFKFLIDTKLWFGGALTCYSVFLAQFLDLNWNYEVGLLILASVCLGYNFDQLVDLKFQSHSVPKLDHLRKVSWIGFLLFLVGASAIAIGILFLNAPFIAKAATLTCIVINLFYSVPLLPSRSKGKLKGMRLKDIVGVKSFCVAATITFGLIGITLPYSGYPSIDLTLPFLIIALYTFLLVFNNTVIRDLPDIEADQISKVPTIPVLIGIARTKQILYCLDLLTIASLFVLSVTNHLDFSKTITLTLTFFAVIIHVHAAENEQFPGKNSIYFYRTAILYYLPLLFSTVVSFL
jgi:4-hydroxybenzoate polyprenyltransferase